MTEFQFQRVDKARHRCYRWQCAECSKTFDYASRSQDGAVNARAIDPVYCPECGACDFVRSVKSVLTTNVPSDSDRSNLLDRTLEEE
jgi:hypothetical protein